MGDVVDSGIITTLPGDPDRVLESALGNLETVVIVGYGIDGEEYFASNISDAAEVTWILRRAEWRLYKMVDEMSGE